jgi:transcriptional regulator with GAF, ATPase, and Fis domain
MNAMPEPAQDFFHRKLSVVSVGRRSTTGYAGFMSFGGDLVTDIHLLSGSFSRQARAAVAAPVMSPAIELDGMIACAPSMREVVDRLRRVAPTDTTVLITGETGTGKELLARALHRYSRRAAVPLVTLNLAAIPESLIAAELFGHEAGAFTGASHRRIGRFELADRGTIFLDEVGDLSAEMQVALLRVVQEGEFERVGASQTRHINVRIVAATNRDLSQAMAKERFRADLFYRLNVFPIHLPPLRERRQDIPALAHDFLGRIAGRLGRPFTGIEPASIDRLMAFDWPGNIRQLQSVIERSAILCDEGSLRVSSNLFEECRPNAVPDPTLDGTLLGHERQLIENTLRLTRGRVSGRLGAAERLGIPASTLESKIRRLQISKMKFRFGE